MRTNVRVTAVSAMAAAGLALGLVFSGPGSASACPSLDECPRLLPGTEIRQIAIDHVGAGLRDQGREGVIRQIVIDLVGAGLRDEGRQELIRQIAIDHVGAGFRVEIDGVAAGHLLR